MFIFLVSGEKAIDVKHMYASLISLFFEVARLDYDEAVLRF